MSVSNYLQKSDGICRYSYSKLKNVLYLVSAEHVKNVHIDNGEAYIDELTELPLRINGFNIQFNEETSLDERYKFQKTLTLSMHGYVSYKIFEGRYYAIIESEDGTFFMINVDFPSRITHTFNLAQNTNQTDFTFASLSNFPTLKLNAEFEAVSPVCLGLNVYGIDKLELIEKEKARLSVLDKTVISTEPFKKVEFLGNSCSFQEVYDGFNVTDTITFNIALDNYKPSWQYNLLEFLDNRYSAIITPKGNDNKYYSGYNFGLQPNYTIQTSTNAGESDIITVTLIEMSSQGSTASRDWKEEQKTETKWRWVKRVGETVCFECIGFGKARYLVKQQVDYFGNPTGNYQVMEGYESEYPNFHIVQTFTEEEIFDTSECSDGNYCHITTSIPNTIYFNSVTCNTYTVRTSCDWEITNIPSNITVNPTSGSADTDYTVSICNTLTPTPSIVENYMTLKCCDSNRVINIKTSLDNSCIRPSTQYVNCLTQNVVFAYDGNCRLRITSIDSRLTYAIGNNTLTVRVPRNYGTSAITWTIVAENCGCSTGSTTAVIVQDKQYERWVESDGYLCENGNSYKIERLYTGTTQNNINVRTDVTRAGQLITSGDTRCSSYSTKWQWDDASYYCDNGDKFKAEFEYISYDGTNWIKTGRTRLGELVEADSEWCDNPVTYSWTITSRYECESGTSYYLYQRYEKRPDQDPIPTYPNYWSIDGDGTMSRVVKQQNDPNCGYIPPVTPLYRWTNIDITRDYVCDECFKFIATYTGGTTYSIPCNSSAELTSGETRPSGYDYSGMTEAEIGYCVTSIGNEAIRSCTSLTSITIPDSVTSIGDYAFYFCDNLTSITIPDSVTSIGDYAFQNCRSLSSVAIPSGVTSIGNRVFEVCYSLTSVTIPSGVTSIGNMAFEYCTGLTSVIINAVNPPTLGRSVFQYTNENFVIYVPAASVEVYKSASGWSTYASRIQAIP